MEMCDEKSYFSTMKTAQNSLKPKWPFVTIDPALNQLQDKVRFTEKLEVANKVLQSAKLPANKHSS